MMQADGRLLCIDTKNPQVFLFRMLLRKLAPMVRFGILVENHAAFQPIDMITTSHIDSLRDCIFGVLALGEPTRAVNVVVQYKESLGVVFVMDGAVLKVEKLFLPESVHLRSEEGEPHGTKRNREFSFDA
jgi:hypothetical protein